MFYFVQIRKADSIIRFGAYENSMICFLPFLPTKSIYFLATSFSITTTTPAFSGESDHCGLRKMTLWKLDCGRKKGFDKALFSFMSLVCPFVFAPTHSTILSIYCNLSWCFIAIFGSPLLLPFKIKPYSWLLILRKYFHQS